ncbi:MAG: hypothetical protein F4129_04090 [Acidimicrobiia bacterium]|nr:hypothetical protein [Acidimicrobiia bacterium]
MCSSSLFISNTATNVPSTSKNACLQLRIWSSAMRIERLGVFTFPMPFKTVIRHASASRRRVSNLIVVAHGRDGQTGYGEGCPREYVTGETVLSSSRFIDQYADSLIAQVTDAHSLRDWIEAHRSAIDANPAAFCAMETAVLDLLGKTQKQSVEDLLEVDRPENQFQYSAVLADWPLPVFWWQHSRYRVRGFQDFKVKLSGDVRRDRRRLGFFSSRASHRLRLRVDANNLWKSPDECQAHLNSMPVTPFAIEEPLRSGDLEGCRQIADALAIKVVLDESLVRARQLESLDDPERWIINLRVSKMGGVIRSLEVAREAVRRDVGVIVGCHVGETGILSRAALTLMQAVGDRLVAAEGAFGTQLLRRDLTLPSLRFDWSGRLELNRVAGMGASGFGLSLDPRAELIPVEHRTAAEREQS